MTLGGAICINAHAGHLLRDLAGLRLRLNARGSDSRRGTTSGRTRGSEGLPNQLFDRLLREQEIAAQSRMGKGLTLPVVSKW